MKFNEPLHSRFLLADGSEPHGYKILKRFKSISIDYSMIDISLADISDLIEESAAVAWDRDGVSGLINDYTCYMNIYHNKGYIDEYGDKIRDGWYLYIKGEDPGTYHDGASAVYIVDEKRWRLSIKK